MKMVMKIFKSVMKELRRKDHQIENPAFMIFDMIHQTEFDNQKGDPILSEQITHIKSMVRT